METELERMQEAERKAKVEAQAAWLMLSCQACVLRDCYRAECVSMGDAGCEKAARDACKQAGCHASGDLQNCIAFTEGCRAQDQ